MLAPHESTSDNPAAAGTPSRGSSLSRVTRRRQRRGNTVTRFFRRSFTSDGNLDEGLELLSEYLGLTSTNDDLQTSKSETVKTSTQQHAQAVIYTPDMDGQADPGEVVWVSIRTHKAAPMQLRSALIVGRRHHTLLGMLISSNGEHAAEDNWLSIGAGPWDAAGKEAFVRLDKVLEIPESDIQRRGVSMPERRFDRVATRLRTDYGWH